MPSSHQHAVLTLLAHVCQRNGGSGMQAAEAASKQASCPGCVAPVAAGGRGGRGGGRGEDDYLPGMPGVRVESGPPPRFSNDDTWTGGSGQPSFGGQDRF